MKKIYKKPIIEIIENNYFDNILLSNLEVELTENIGAKENIFEFEEENENYFNNYNIWE